MVNTLQRRKEKREPDVNGAAQSGAPAPPEEAQRPRSMTVSAATRVKLSFQIFQFGAKEMAVLAPASTGDALHVVFIWEVLLVWSVGIMQAGGNALLVLTFIEQCTPKKHLFYAQAKGWAQSCWIIMVTSFDGEERKVGEAD